MDHKDQNSYFANSDGLLMLPYYLSISNIEFIVAHI